MHARAKWLKTRSTGGGISGGGERGGTKAINGTNINRLKEMRRAPSP